MTDTPEIVERPIWKYHVRAWGHATLPAVDYFADDVDRESLREYPMQQIALLQPLSRAAIEAGLGGKP